MSAGIQHKLINYEIVPPESVWEKIKEELILHSKLDGLAVTPPPGTWNKIAGVLDGSAPVEDLAAKLYSAEVVPPAATWDKIRATLQTEQEPAIPARKKIPAFIRYAAAAMVIGLIAFGGFRLIKSKTGNPVAVQKERNDIPGATGSITQPVTEQPELNPVAEEARNDAALEESKKTYARLDVQKKKRKAVSTELQFSNYTEPVENNDNPDLDNDVANRYIVLMTPDGNFIRMSKKLSGLVCCVSGEEQDTECREQVEKWRKQLACSSAAHPGNFGDILSLLSSLQED